MSSRAPTAPPSRSRCSRRRTEGSPSRGRAVHRHVMTTRLITFAVTLGLALAASVLTATTALGQPQAPLTRWAVTAADESGPDDRASIQPELDAGQSVTEHLSVQNLGDREETFRLTAADGFTTPTGRFDMLASDEESTEAGTWIDIPDEVTVAAGESEVVPFTIRSEEHTSELQSRGHLVCRLLLEKKKTKCISIGNKQ